METQRRPVLDRQKINGYYLKVLNAQSRGVGQLAMLRTSGLGSLSPQLVAVHSRAGSLLFCPALCFVCRGCRLIHSFSLARGVGMSLPARGSAPCSTSGRGCYVTSPVAGGARYRLLHMLD